MGGIPLHRFTTIAGLLANALDPNGLGGRLGRSAAELSSNYGDMAMRGEQSIRLQRMLALSKAAQERQRLRELSGFLSRVQQPQSSGFRVREGQPEAPGAARSAFGVPPVMTSLEGFDIARGPAPQISLADLAELSGLVDPAGFKAIAEQLERSGQLTPEPLKPMMGSPGQVPINVNTGELIGGGVPLLASQAAPPATNVQASRPAYSARGVDYPAQTGVFAAPAASTVVQEGQPLMVAQPTVQQSTVTPGGTLPPVSRDPNVAFTAPFRPFSPREQAVTAPAGSTTWLTPGEAGRVATPTYRQRTISVPPGGSAVTEGKVTTVPQTERQKMPAAAGGSKGTGKPKDISLVTGRADQAIHRKLGFDPKSDDLRQNPEYQTMLQTATAAMMNNQDFQVVKTPGAKGWFSNEPDRYRVVTGDAASQQPLPTGTHRLSGQRTDRADGWYGQGKDRVQVLNGVIQ